MADTSTIERSIVIEAPAAEIIPFLADLRRWVDWSPWEGQDSSMKRTYGGVQGEVGSSYAWSGNRKAGAGTMAVTRIAPTEIDVDLTFTAPFKSSSKVEFRLSAEDDSTRLVWTMTSPQNLMAKVMRVFVNMDKMIGGDFDKGLAKLKGAVEAR
ncbi:SRPBCC family protein [Frondihabitans cladoniiphilus]|uniref:SRPBCC family protein n=1 Tax=Frondihabitans cladoniiphilus TaxID=715785 RepID=A0ABP8VMY8_9MICO